MNMGISLFAFAVLHLKCVSYVQSAADWLRALQVELTGSISNCQLHKCQRDHTVESLSPARLCENGKLGSVQSLGSGVVAAVRNW